jgi:hypothetical protein
VNLIRRLFGKSDGPEDSGALICPHCERAMEAEHKCAAMSRRFFFGLAAGAAVAVPVAAEIAKPRTVEVPRQLVKLVDPWPMGGAFCTTSCMTVSSLWLRRDFRDFPYMPVTDPPIKKKPKTSGGIW